jgi:hypothetical protein
MNKTIEKKINDLKIRRQKLIDEFKKFISNEKDEEVELIEKEMDIILKKHCEDPIILYEHFRKEDGERYIKYICLVCGEPKEKKESELKNYKAILTTLSYWEVKSIYNSLEANYKGKIDYNNLYQDLKAMVFEKEAIDAKIITKNY